MAEEFLIKYDGGDADHHAIDMRLLGESLQGIDRLVSDFIIIASANRMPKRGERAPLIIKANEPRAGTVSIPALVQESAGLLQLGWQVFGSSGSEMISNWVSSVLSYYSGKQSEAEQAMQHIADMAKLHTEALDRVDQRRHAEAMGMQDLLRTQLEKSNPAAVQAVAPVGPSVRRLLFFRGSKEPKVVIGDEEAEQIRSRAAIEWSPLEPWVLRTDGFTFHNHRMSVEHPDKDGFLVAEVKDPIADAENNPYATAVQRKAVIRVQAKGGYRAGRLEQLLIFDFISEVGDAA